MKNIYFPEEDIVEDDLFYICFMLEKVARFVKKPTSYIVKQIGEKNLYHLLSCAQALHCDNPEKVAREWVNDYAIQEGNFICDEKYDAKKLFHEMSNSKVVYHDVDSYQSLLNIMNSI